jgi:hypothetical protein
MRSSPLGYIEDDGEELDKERSNNLKAKVYLVGIHFYQQGV